MLLALFSSAKRTVPTPLLACSQKPLVSLPQALTGPATVQRSGWCGRSPFTVADAGRRLPVVAFIPVMSDSPLYHLVYQSVASSVLEESELERVLARSRAWNTAHGLTGVLLHCHGSIMQVLEGPRAEVQAIFARIARDRRHCNVVKLADGPIAGRQFAQWSMGFHAVNPAAFARLQGYFDPAQGRVPTQVRAADAGLHAVLANFLAEDPIRF